MGALLQLCYTAQVKLRILHYPTLDPLASQAIYHGVAMAMTDTDDPVLILCSPSATYVCIGMHQSAEQELDLASCEQLELPIIRRHVGGGAVLLDQHQLFFQFVFPRHLVAQRPTEMYRQLLAPILATYRQFGLTAYLQGSNDIHIAGKKVCGCGAASIGTASVVVGNFIFNFDFAMMSQIIRAPSADFRRLFRHQLPHYMTHLRDYNINQQQVIDTLLQQLALTLDRTPYSSELRSDEVHAMTTMQEELSDSLWLNSGKKTVANGIKIAANTYLTEVNNASGRCIRLQHQQKLVHMEFFDQAQRFNTRLANLIGIELSLPALQAALASLNLCDGEIQQLADLLWRDIVSSKI